MISRSVQARKQASKQTYTCVQCSYNGVGLAQAHPIIQWVVATLDQLEYMAPEIQISYHTGRVRVRSGQVNRISGAFSSAVYSN